MGQLNLIMHESSYYILKFCCGADRGDIEGEEGMEGCSLCD